MNLGFPNLIAEFAAGDSYRLHRSSFTLPDEAQENQEYITKMWFTVQEDPSDEDSLATIQLTITPTETPQGKVISPLELPWTSRIEFRFDLTPTDTKKLVPEQTYFYDIRYLTSGGKLYRPERGRIIAAQGVTKAES